MRATLLEAVRAVALREVPDPVLHHPSDVVVRVTATCICGSELHPYRGHAPTTFPKQLRPPHPESAIPEPVQGRIRRRPILGGLINTYEAAA
jgi:hypothetical protein